MNLVIKRTREGELALHDSSTGELLPAQMSLEVIQHPGESTKVVVTFDGDSRDPDAVNFDFDKKSNSPIPAIGGYQPDLHSSTEKPPPRSE